MPQVITAAQLRAVLGVSTGLYNDAYLNQIIETAEEAIGALLVKDQVCVCDIERVNNLVTLYLAEPYEFFVGETVIVEGVRKPNFDGSQTVTAVIDSKTIQYVTNQSSDVPKQKLRPKATVHRQGRGLDYYQGVPPVESAMLEIAVDVFQSRQASGGQIQGVDFVPAPYRMGKSLFQRVAGLLVSYRDEESIVG